MQALIDDHPDPAFREAYKRELAQKGEAERERRLWGNWYSTEEAGTFFRKDYFPAVDYAPTHEARKVRSWDCAWSESSTADWSVGILISLEPSGHWTVMDALRLRGTFAHVERAVKLAAELDGRDTLVRLPRTSAPPWVCSRTWRAGSARAATRSG